MRKKSQQQSEDSRGVAGVTGTSGRPTIISTQPNRVGDRTTTLRRLLINSRSPQLKVHWIKGFVWTFRGSNRLMVRRRILKRKKPSFFFIYTIVLCAV